MKNININYSIIIFLTIIFGILNIYFVFKFGRLNYELFVDDVGYALSPLRSFIDENHIWKIDFLNAHSPYQFLIASIGLKIFGYNDYAIYLSNFLPLIVLSLIIYEKFGKENKILFFFISLYILSSPLVYRLINEFRPDIFYGIILTYALNCSIYFNLNKLKNKLILIILLTSSLYIKPSFIFHTFFYFIIILIIINFKAKLSFKKIISNLVNYLFIPLLISLVIFLKRYQAIIDHYVNSFKSEGFLFDSEKNLIDLIYFNLFDIEYGMVFIGFNIYLFIILFLTSLPYLMNKFRRKELLNIYLIPLIGIISFLILCQTRVINQHVYATFHFSIILSSGMLFKFFWDYFYSKKIFITLIVLFLTTMSISNFQFYKYNTFGILSNFERIEIAKADNKNIIKLIHKTILPNYNNKKEIKIYVPFYTPVNFLSLNWYQSLLEFNNKNKINKKTFFLFETPNTNFDKIQKTLDESDIIIIPKSKNKYIFKFFEINELVDTTHDKLSDNKNIYKHIENNNFKIYFRSE